MQRPSANSAEARLDPDKKWVWVEDKVDGYIAGYIIEEKDNQIKVNLTTDETRWVNIDDTQKVNPAKFDRLEDMADLSYLNEASVAHNLKMRYHSNLIYTYSGLFLVSVNPYYKLPIYTEKMVRAYKNKRRTEMPPHIYAIADSAFHFMLQNRENQSILITGESGAGKTENTKKVIQYLTSVAADRSQGKITGELEQQILRANPILEAFGNAQTIRNNNSSRFGKFIRIEFSSGGQIAGANIEKYLFEKSRVTQQSPHERNYHIFYQFMKGAPQETKDQLLINGDLNDYAYTKNSLKNIDGVDDITDFKITKDSMDVMNFTIEKQLLLFRVLAAVLHLGNIRPVADRDDQAQLRDTSAAEKLCHVLSIPVAEFTKGLLRPQMKAGRDWVTQARNVGQVLYSLESLARAIYDRMFGLLVEWINSAMDRPSEKSTFIGVLDIAGFEIFDINSFEQLCINYNNEKLQQFFNHHMFKREQEEYLREGINWKFIDFGLDLQPTIDLIEKSNPIGIFSCLDEECVMPKATDKTFTEKLITLWKDKSDKFGTLKFNQGFMLKHYASNVEYRTEGWLDKNKDPLNENITRLLANSTERYIADLFEDYSKDATLFASRTRTKKGLFRTVAQRHKEQLSLLMSQLNATEPHFVRCILPNQDKKPGKINTPLVLDQLRCNGVLEGIRICRAGFPNRLPFSEFRQRYEILAPGAIAKGFMDGKKATQLILEAIQLDPGRYRVGGSKVFFRSGVLAELEEARDANLSNTISQVQATCRGFLARKLYRKRLDQLKAIKIIQKNARVYVQLREWSWWKLYTKVKPLLNVTRVDEELKKKEDSIKYLENQITAERHSRIDLEKVKVEIESEKRKLEELLISERNTALDNEEILRRTQKREMALEEELRDVAGELEILEAQLEEAVQVKSEALNKYESLGRQLEEERILVQNLDKEKQSRDKQLNQAQQELTVQLEKTQKLENDRRSLDLSISELQEELALGKDQEAELLKTKLKLEAHIADVSDKLSKEYEVKDLLTKKCTKAEQELKHANDLITALEFKVDELQGNLDKQIVDFSNLGERLKSEETSKLSIEKERRDLNLKIETYENELEIQKSEKETAIKAKKKLEEELQELHNLIEQKGDEESKQNEHRRLREAELNELRTNLETCQAELQDVRRSNQQLVDSLKSEVEKLKMENESLVKSRDISSAQAKDLESKLETAEHNVNSLEKMKRQLEHDIDLTRDRASDLDASLGSLKLAKDDMDKLLIVANSKNEESESFISRLQREKQALERQVTLAQEEVTQEAEKREGAESTKKRQAVELADYQAQLEESESVKAELRRKLTAKASELEELKDQFSAESSERVASVEEAKRRIEVQLAELQPAYDDLARQYSSVDKARARLVSEVEDLKHEIEHEHTNARNAEKLVKQIEAQLDSLNIQLETERQERESVEANHRKLQSSHALLEKQIEERHEQLATVTKSKSDMETELRALIDEIGDGGRNIHELEKAKRRLESEVEAKDFEIDELEAKYIKAEEIRRQTEEQLSDLKKMFESDLLAKDAQLEETRRLLLKEVNQLGERLDEEIASKSELSKVRKRLEDEIDDLKSNVNYSTQSKSDLEKAKKKAEDYIKTLQASLESEEKLKVNFEELAQRHEHKSNQLQTKLEGLELQLEAVEKTKKQLEARVHDLTIELEEGDSKSSLIEALRRIEKEKQQLEEDLLEEREVRNSLESTKRDTSSDLDTLKNQAKQEVQDQLEKLEESRRALLVAQRMAQQELESKHNEMEAVLRSREELLSEVSAIKHRLEEEIKCKNAEAASQRKYKRAYSDISIKLEAEQAKTSELKESIEMYKSKIEDLMNGIESAELNKSKSSKIQASLENQLEGMEEDLVSASARLEDAELRIHELEEQLIDFQSRGLEDNDLSSLSNSRLQLADELKRLKDDAERDFQDRAKEIEEMRAKYQQRLTDLTSELEASQNDLLSYQSENLRLASTLDELNTKLDSSLSSTDGWKRDRNRLEAKLEELSASHIDLTERFEGLSDELDRTKTQLRHAQGELEVKDSELISLSKSKKFLQEQLDDIEGRYSSADQTRLATEKSLSAVGQEASELKELLDQYRSEVDTLSHRLNRSESLLSESHSELSKARQFNSETSRAKQNLDKQVKDLTLKVIDLESTNLSESSSSAQRLSTRIDELANQLDSEVKDKNELLRSLRKAERQVRELQFQVQDRDKQRAFTDSNVIRTNQAIQQLKAQIDALESSESSLQLMKRRAEREAAEEKEKNVRLENEIERLKLRLERSMSQAASPYGSIKSPSLVAASIKKSPTINTLSMRSKTSSLSRGPSIASSDFRDLLFKFSKEEESNQ